MNQFSPYLFGARYLNDVNAQYLSSGGQAQVAQNLNYTAMLGQKISLGVDEAAQFTNPSTTGYTTSTLLQPGEYQLVKLKSSLTITPARGLIVWWDAAADPNSFIVTTDAPVSTGGRLAGVLLNAGTAGYYVWIQVSGAPYVKGKASLATTAAKDQVLIVDTATATVNNVAATTALTVDNINLVIGQAADLPVAATLKRVHIGAKPIVVSGLQ